MQFLADVMLLCPVCQGKRFNTDVLSVHHAGKTVADSLDSAAVIQCGPRLSDWRSGVYCRILI